MPDISDYQLQPDRIVETIGKLQQRIVERFPNSSLAGVCGKLHDIAAEAHVKSAWFGKPVRWLRVLCLVISILIVVVSMLVVFFVGDRPEQGLGLTELIQVLEAGINDVVLIGAAIFFLLTMETRYKRGKALRAIHQLRSIAHVIDMHQLTKDPERVSNLSYANTQSSPGTSLTLFELHRYLDYCSEMLSLTGKIAAVYVEQFDDAVAIVSANEVETLTTGLSRKIWQKLSIIQLTESDMPADSVRPKVTKSDAAKSPTPAKKKSGKRKKRR